MSPGLLLQGLTVNAWRDLCARLRGLCCHAPDQPHLTATRVPVWLRCALRRGHIGVHEHGAYVWSTTGRVESGWPAGPTQRHPRYPVPTLRQHRRRQRWLTAQHQDPTEQLDQLRARRRSDAGD